MWVPESEDEPRMCINVGDRVKSLIRVGNVKGNGRTGTVIHVYDEVYTRSGVKLICVQFDECIDGHAGIGGRYGYCWNIHETSAERIQDM